MGKIEKTLKWEFTKGAAEWCETNMGKTKVGAFLDDIIKQFVASEDGSGEGILTTMSGETPEGDFNAVHKFNVQVFVDNSDTYIVIRGFVDGRNDAHFYNTTETVETLQKDFDNFVTIILGMMYDVLNAEE